MPRNIRHIEVNAMFVCVLWIDRTGYSDRSLLASASWAGPGQADQPKEELVYFGANSLIEERSNRAEISISVKSIKSVFLGART